MKNYKNGKTLPGLSEDETRYFQYLLTRKLGVTTPEQWEDLCKLNQKTLSVMYKEK
jgi:hypothetical protein